MWSLAKKSDLPQIKTFLLSEESYAVKITELVQFKDFEIDYKILFYKNSKFILHTIFILKNGIIYPCSHDEQALADVVDNHFIQLWNKLNIQFYLIMGEKNAVNTLKSLFSSSHFIEREYYTMVLHSDRFHPQIDESLIHHIQRLSPTDFKSTFPLRMEYELEEVVLSRQHYSKRASLLHWRETLEQYRFFGIHFANSWESIAGVNAIGYNYFQLGGIYTNKDSRGNGYAQRVLSSLIHELLLEKSGISLFVNKKNRSAIHLYEKLGFLKQNYFLLSYRQRK